jgi:hypothetical protein
MLFKPFGENPSFASFVVAVKPSYFKLEHYLVAKSRQVF